jgi:NADH-quinone oxidoreductase subunit G
VDTICTRCEKGCSTTVWIKAKPEWAKGSQLVRTTPRFNPEVNGYWMCDIGRFDYHWVEGDQRLAQPAVRRGAAVQPATWADALAAAGAALKGAGGSLRVLASAHASHEELFAAARLAQELLGDAARDAIAVSWTSSAKVQPAATKFKVPEVDAPNVAGAKALGLIAPDASTPDLDAMKAAIAAATGAVVYVLDPGPAGSIGDVSWIVEARAAGRIGTLIVQAVEASELSRAADVVLPGCAWAEKHAAYTNATGQTQSTAKAIVPPGEARDDWQILCDVALAAGVSLGYESLPQLRAAIVELLPNEPACAALAELEYLKPARASHWLEASNPSERVKWDAMFLDLPPFKFERMFDAGPRRGVIELKPVK